MASPDLEKLSPDAQRLIAAAAYLCAVDESELMMADDLERAAAAFPKFTRAGLYLKGRGLSTPFLFQPDQVTIRNIRLSEEVASVLAQIDAAPEDIDSLDILSAIRPDLLNTTERGRWGRQPVLTHEGAMIVGPVSCFDFGPEMMEAMGALFESNCVDLLYLMNRDDLVRLDRGKP